MNSSAELEIWLRKRQELDRYAASVLGSQGWALLESYGRMMQGPRSGRYVSSLDASEATALVKALKRGEERIGELGRIVVTAQLLSETDGTGAPVIPALHEASMLYMRGSQIRMRGFELVDGIQYGQTWEVRVA